jgi:hypothetical protein
LRQLYIYRGRRRRKDYSYSATVVIKGNSRRGWEFIHIFFKLFPLSRKQDLIWKKNEEEEKKMKRLITAVVLVGIVLTSTASATILGTVDIQNHNNALSDIGTIWGGGLSGLTGYTGVYSWTNAGGTGLGTQVPNWGFCIELTQEPYTGWQNVIPLNEAPLPVQYGTPMQTTKANYICELWDEHFDSSWLTGGTANKKMAEAFGAAVWEIIYEALPASPLSWDVNTGTGFHATGIDQAATANTWLHQLNGDTTHLCNLVATSAPTGQDYLVQLPHTPEPVTICLLGLGGLALLKNRRA